MQGEKREERRKISKARIKKEGRKFGQSKLVVFSEVRDGGGG